MNILITGGCGFLGSNLAAAFQDEGARLCIVDALYRKGTAINLGWLQERASKVPLSFVQADISDSDVVMSVFRRHGPFDFIIHVGGQVAMTSSLQDPRRDMLTNVVGTFNILEAARELSPNALLAYSSTNKVYGDLNWLHYDETATRYWLRDFPRGLDESIPLDFSTPYGCSKGAADQYVRDWHRVYGLKTVVFRHSSIYGGRQFASFDQGWVGWFCLQGIQQKQAWANGVPIDSFSVSGTGKQVRDVLHAKDVVSLYKAAFSHRNAIAGHIFNVGGGEENALSILELLKLIADILNFPALEYILIPRRASDQVCFVANIDKARQMLGWSPRIGSHEGILSMLEWVESQLKST